MQIGNNTFNDLLLFWALHDVHKIEIDRLNSGRYGPDETHALSELGGMLSQLKQLFNAHANDLYKDGLVGQQVSISDQQLAPIAKAIEKHIVRFPIGIAKEFVTALCQHYRAQQPTATTP